MHISAFDDFLQTINKEKISSWVDCMRDIPIKVKTDKNNTPTIDLNNLVSANLFLTQRILCEYHEWLCKLPD